MTLGINKRADHLGDGVRVEDRQEGNLGAERIPKTGCGQHLLSSSIEVDKPVERVKVWLGACPQRVLASIVLGVDHGSVDTTVEVRKNGLLYTVS